MATLTEARAIARRLRDRVKRDGGLVGVNAGAKILGIAPPNFKRYRDRLTAIEVEGSADVFVRAEVEALRDELRSEG